MFTLVPGRVFGLQDITDRTCQVADESPVALSYNTVPHLLLMATPAELEDLAIGFSITDGVCARGDIRGVAIDFAPGSHTADVQLSPAAFERFLSRRSLRVQRSYTSCGICGVESIEALPRPVAGTRSEPTLFDIGAIRLALRALPDRQTLNRVTGAMHAAAWVRLDGTIDLVREDVGRHNALDKLIGALAAREPGFCLITSRCSTEMVLKAAAAGFEMLVSISAPTSLAIAEAQRLDLTLVALARADSQTAYAGEHRLRGEQP